jgi:CTP synthase (UTP-ammonia lyase)
MEVAKSAFRPAGGEERPMKQGKKRAKGPIWIGVIGDFNPDYHSHFATSAAVYDAAVKLRAAVHLRWVPTPSLAGDRAGEVLKRWDGLIASPGSPYESFEGMLNGIRFARTRNWPFAGT